LDPGFFVLYFRHVNPDPYPYSIPHYLVQAFGCNYM